MNALRPLQPLDRDAVLKVYRCSVASCDPQLYTAAQRHAWARQADEAQPAPALLHSLNHGSGLVCSDPEGKVVAFGVREPHDRVALLYCHPSHQRQGLARRLLQAMEQQAGAEGIQKLRTEASLLSHALFCDEGWQVQWREELLIHGVHFRRFRLAKTLAPILEPWPKPNSSNSSKRSAS
jgi:GNAT superfamily N-acetyltransferase